MILNGLPWKRTEIILSFLRLHPSTAFWILLFLGKGYSFLVDLKLKGLGVVMLVTLNNQRIILCGTFMLLLLLLSHFSRVRLCETP